MGRGQLPETFHVRAGNRCAWCADPWPCAVEQDAERRRQAAAQLCTCDHPRDKHFRSALGGAACIEIVNFDQDPPWKGCPCLGFDAGA